MEGRDPPIISLPFQTGEQITASQQNQQHTQSIPQALSSNTVLI